MSWLLCSRRKNWALVGPWAPIADFLAKHGWTRWTLFWRTFVLAFLYGVPNVAWAMAVERVSVSLNIGTQQASIVFVFFFSVIFLGDKVRLAPVVATIVCLGGVVLFAIGLREAKEVPGGDSNVTGGGGGVGGGGQQQPATIADYIILAVFPIGIATFDVAFKKWSADLKAVEEVCVLTGTVGLVNALTLWPIMPIVDAAGIWANGSRIG